MDACGVAPNRGRREPEDRTACGNYAPESQSKLHVQKSRLICSSTNSDLTCSRVIIGRMTKAVARAGGNVVDLVLTPTRGLRVNCDARQGS
jgi:hypothetical protein